MDKLVRDMSERELISVFSSDQSNRMEVLKAGERLLQSDIQVSESEANSILQRVVSSRFETLAIDLAPKLLSTISPVHSGLGKTLLRLGVAANNSTFFSEAASRIIPDLLRPEGELGGPYVRGLLRFQGYQRGLAYFEKCPPSHSRYGILLPEFLFGLYENQFYSECLQFYHSLCERLRWRHIHSIFPGTETAYYNRQRDIKVMQHSRVYGAAIGSALAQGNKDFADQLMSEMNFWGVQPLRETYYDYLDYCDHSDSYKATYSSYLQQASQYHVVLTEMQKSFLLSLAKCCQYDLYVPMVLDHNKYRYYRKERIDETAQTIQMSVRLTPPSYQRMEVYRVLKEMQQRPKQRWYDGCLVIQLDRESEGVRRLLTTDLQPAIEFKLLDFDEIRVELSSVYEWLDIHDRLNKQFSPAGQKELSTVQ